MEMESCKLFIGGISWETSEDRLRDYFHSFGEVLEAVIMKDRATGRARGFGFVVFADPNVAERVVLLKHIIDGKIVEAKKAVPRDDHVVFNKSNSSLQGSPGPSNSKKIFVGGLASSVTEAEFKKYFAQFGMITDVVVMYDHRTQRPRGFGFISYDSEEAVDKVLQKTFHELNGKMVEVKLAVPKDMALNTMRNQMNVNSFGTSRISSLLNEYTQGFSPSPISGYGVKPEVRYSPAVGNRGGFSPFGHGYGIELNFEPNQTQNYGSGSSGGFGRPFSPGYAASLGRFGSQMESGGASVGNGSVLNAAPKNHLWGNGGLGYMSNSPISRSSFSGNSGMSSLGSIGDNWGTVARARSSYHDSLYSDSMWLSLPAKAEEGLGMGPLDFMSRGPAGYINRQPNGGMNNE
ncbi:RNA-binding protein-like [Arabidopsis thaliana]|uniref:RNA-binding protein-like n=1 Tax=Arabidopsis thaliana TaxID=3702 RepID=Q9FGJ5_ARATH|nr:RNA-binding protein-like [Arabidopsis thaliana]